MINWRNYSIEIDESARIQLDHYFNDLGRILDNQHLSYKKEEVFSELEQHIIDYIRNNKIEKITFQDALDIIAELGPPDEYTDYSTLPNLINNVSKANSINSEIPKTQITNYVLCENCREKNEEGSLYCINCGNRLAFRIGSNQNDFQKSIINRSVKSKTYFLFNMLSIYLFGFFVIFSILLGGNFSLALFFQIFFVTNELILIPLAYLFTIIAKRKTIASTIELFLAQIIKLGTILVPIPIINAFMYPGNELLILAYLIYLFVVPIILTKILFVSRYSKTIYALVEATTIRPTKTLNFGVNFISGLFGLLYLILYIPIMQENWFINNVVELDILLIIIFGLESLLLIIFRGNKSENFDHNNDRRTFSQFFKVNPAFFFSIFSFVVFAILFIVNQVDNGRTVLIIDVFLLNELIIIPLFFLYTIINQKSSRFEFLTFFFSYLTKYSAFMILLLLEELDQTIFHFGFSIIYLLGVLLFLITPIVTIKVCYYSKLFKRLQEQLKYKSKFSHIIIYCFIEFLIIITMFYLFYINNSSLSFVFSVILINVIIIFSYLFLDLFNGLKLNRNSNRGKYIEIR